MIHKNCGVCDDDEIGFYDEADGTHSGQCRGCFKYNNVVSNDNGYCQDCD